jgi:hypothetical protein
MINEHHGPQPIACLTAETAEALYLLGEDQRIVDVAALEPVGPGTKFFQ